MPFLLVEILNYQGSAHLIGVGSLSYSLNQEKYLRYFMEDGEVPLDNNATEQTIRPFYVGKKNWVMIDIIAGAETSVIIYSIAETAKANNLKPIIISNIFWRKSPNTWMP